MVDSLRFPIARHPFFAGMQPEQLELIEGCGRNTRFGAGEVIFRAGETADRFFLVRQGRIAIQIPVPGKEPITVQTVEAGHILGWSWIFPPCRTYFDARCVEKALAVEFDGACLRARCESDVALAYELTRRFAQVMRERLRATHLQLLDMYKVPAV